MVRAREVNPNKWQNMVILFENDDYSVISGEYEGTHSLGERWNGQGDDIGFPSQGGNPLWHVVPPLLALPVLHGILQELCRVPYPGSQEHSTLIVGEIQRFSS
ncbi:MAG: hypothetical protein ACW97P_10975 [Candidatus Hodarchaeales archaeon]|jgi:hypothetical protein